MLVTEEFKMYVDIVRTVHQRGGHDDYREEKFPSLERSTEQFKVGGGEVLATFQHSKMRTLK